MIYRFEHNNKLEQGDILKNLPYFDPFTDGFIEDWVSAIKHPDQGDATIPDAEPISKCGVLLTQSCDIRPENNILFAEIKAYSINIKKPRSRVKKIRKVIRDETRTYFLPADGSIQAPIEFPATVDFRRIFAVPAKLILQDLSIFFVARLKEPAVVILKEKISRFFSRLAFDDVIFFQDGDIAPYIDEFTGETSESVEQALRKVGRTLPDGSSS